MDRDAEFCNDTRWVHAINKLRNKRVPEYKLAQYTLERIHALQQSVLSGEFQWEVPYICKIPKKNGKFRECFALPLNSRIVMSVIADIYYDCISFRFDPHCVSYQQGVSIKGITRDVRAELAKKDVVGYKVDLSMYFDSVPLGNLDELLQDLDRGAVIDRYVWDFYHDTRLRTKEGITQRYRSLCQGCAMGPLLANLYLDDIDYLLGSQCMYWRYSDDILLIGANAEELLQILHKMLEQKGLSLNPDKVRPISGTFEFLGASIGDSICIARENMDDIKSQIKSVCSKAKHTRSGQRSAISKVQHILLHEDWNYHSLFCYYASLVTGYTDFIELEQYSKACIRSVLTGKHNFTTNLKKTPDEMLTQLGWVSLVDLLNLYNTDREGYFKATRRIGGNYVLQ